MTFLPEFVFHLAVGFPTHRFIMIPCIVRFVGMRNTSLCRKVCSMVLYNTREAICVAIQQKITMIEIKLFEIVINLSRFLSDL